MANNVPAHKCRWYPISWDKEQRPALYACAGTMRCVKLVTAKQLAKMKDPEFATELPTERVL